MVAIDIDRTISRWAVLVASALIHSSMGAAPSPGVAQISPATEYSGSADASGGAACGPDFFITCDDEDAILRVYRRTGGGGPVAQIDLGKIRELRVPGAKKELDLEAAAPLGDKVYWIGSHGNSKEGKVAPNRRQLFATTVSADQGKFRVALAGQPYRRLIEDLIATPALREFNLADAAADGRAPKDEGGLNIEGLAASTEGHLLLGFRNPVPQGRALLVPVLNPEEIIRGAQARIGEPIRLDLGGRGIRDLVLVGREYFILAGDRGEADRRALSAQLYRWQGVGAVPQLVAEFPKLNPEAIIVHADAAGRELHVLSDDGRKPPLPAAKRTFRGVTVRL
jgi:hypothetical protein